MLGEKLAKSVACACTPGILNHLSGWPPVNRHKQRNLGARRDTFREQQRAIQQLAVVRLELQVFCRSKSIFRNAARLPDCVTGRTRRRTHGMAWWRERRR